MDGSVLRPPFIPRRVHTSWTVFFLLIIGLALIEGGVILFQEPSPNDSKVLLLSPLASGKLAVPTDNPQLDVVRRVNTTDHYPPNEFFPSRLQPVTNQDLAISAPAYAVMDANTKTLLFARNLTQERSIASVSKVMTALIALESTPLDTEMTVSSSAGSIGEASMGISAGERFSLSQLLYGALLPSGNDAAEAIAEGVGKYQKHIAQSETDGGGARSWFLKAMNDKAQKLGMMDTYFFNPTGLDEETAASSNFSTPLDLLALGTYAIANPTLAQIVSTRYHTIPYEAGTHKALYLQNILQLSDSFPGIEGIKPGSSVFAGETLLSYLRHDDRRFIAVVLDSQHTKDDIVALYKAALALP